MLIAQVMQEHFLESDIDGFVYFTANTVARVPGNARELIYWVPGYRRHGDELGDFVNRLGAGWHDFYRRKIGQDVPLLRSENPRILRSMQLGTATEDRRRSPI